MTQTPTLQDIKTGEKALVIAVDAPEAERGRLESMGILPGVEVGVLADNGGPILVSVGDARMAVERKLAAMVIVA